VKPAAAAPSGSVPGAAAQVPSADAADAAVADAAAEDASVADAEAALDAEASPSTEPELALPADIPSAEAPSPLPSAEAPPKVIPPGVSVKFGDEAIFAVRVPLGGRTPQERADAATKALHHAAVGAKGSDVKVQRKDQVAVVLVGPRPVIQLTAEDAEAAGDSSLDVHAASVAASIRDAIESERRRAAIAKSVFSFSLLVFFGLIAFYLVQKVGEFAQRARGWIDEHGERVLAVRVRRIEVVSPGTVRSTALVGLTVGKWLAQVGIIYAWVVAALSLFEATRGYTEKMTGFVISPLSALMARVAMGLPMLVVLVIAGFAVFVLVRFTGLFFSSVTRRETVVSWIPQDFVAPVSTLVRFGIIVGALVLLAPLVTGNTEGVLARGGWIVLFAIGLAGTPVLATGIVGTLVVFSRRVRAGQHVEVGPHRGRISLIGLLELHLEDDDGVEIRVPYLYLLLRPLSVIGIKPRFVVELPVSASARPSDVKDALGRAASGFDPDHRLTLVNADAERALYRVSVASERPEARSELALALVEALSSAKIPLGRLRSAGDP
jgi:small-conductance mechanosensitive channel